MKALLVGLVVLLGLVVVADRVGVRITDRVVAEQIAQRGGLAAPPDVDITGVPFLTQVVTGTYDDVRVGLSAQDLGQPAGTTAEVSLRGVHLPLSDVVSGSVAEIPVDRIDGHATLPYPLLAQQLGGNATVTRAGDGLRVTKTVTVLGIKVPLTGTGTVHLVGGALALTVRHASVVGIDVPGLVVRQAQGLLDLRYTLPTLPFGLRLTGLQATDAGVVVSVHATGTVLR